MITYQLESWDDYFKDCQGLWKEHYDEIGTLKEKRPMKPDVPKYKLIESEGRLHLLTVRKDGAMVGYHLTFIYPHPHYADVLSGFVDSYYVSKDARKTLFGIGPRLIKEAEKTLKQRGVKHIFTETKPFLDNSRLFEALGWKFVGKIYSKWIGD